MLLVLPNEAGCAVYCNPISFHFSLICESLPPDHQHCLSLACPRIGWDSWLDLYDTNASFSGSRGSTRVRRKP